MNWAAASAIAAWVAIIGGVLGWVVKSTVKSALSDAMEKFDERYAGLEVTDERFERVHDRLNDQAKQIERLDVRGRLTA